MISTYLHTIHNHVLTVGRITPNGVQLLGTCFLLNKPGLLATAAHVPSNDEQNLVIVISQSTSLMTYQDTSDSKVQVVNAKIHTVDLIRDICILKIEANALSNLPFGGADDVQVSNNLTVIGFPHCTEERKVLTYQSTMVGAKVLIESAGIKSKHLILNIQTKPGQSGSPIFRDSDGKLVAMLIGSYAPHGSGGIIIGGIDPHTLHQTTHAISSEYILDMI